MENPGCWYIFVTSFALEPLVGQDGQEIPNFPETSADIHDMASKHDMIHLKLMYSTITNLDIANRRSC